MSGATVLLTSNGGFNPLVLWKFVQSLPWFMQFILATTCVLGIVSIVWVYTAKNPSSEGKKKDE
jgi:hypothetical protein